MRTHRTSRPEPLFFAAAVVLVAAACGDSGGGSDTNATNDGGGSSGGDGGSGGNGGGGSGSEGGGGGGGGALSDPGYREGFGKNATGGDGMATCTVTSSAESGAGSFASCFNGDTLTNTTVQFAVSTVTWTDTLRFGSNVTFDGCANGQNGVTFDQDATAATRALVAEDPATNMVVRCINFRSNGAPSSGVNEFDNLTFDGTNGASISTVFVDRCTFVEGSDGALDITGNVSNVTVQRSLFYGNSHTMLIKYNSRSNFSIHHNVFTRNGERNPQVKGDMQLFDFVNNVVHQNDVTAYPDGTETSPYGTLFWSCGAGCDSEGAVSANAVNNAYLGAGADIQLMTDPAGSNDGVFLGGNLCSPAGNCPASPKATANDIPADFVVTTLDPSELKAQLLPNVGAPNRTAQDTEYLDAVSAALP